MKLFTIGLNSHGIASIRRNHDRHLSHCTPFIGVVSLAVILSVLGLSGCTGPSSAAGTRPAAPSTAGPAVSTALGLVITTSKLPAGQQQTPYAAQLGANGGTAPYSWSVSSGLLPLGLTLNSTAAISGTPTQSGIFSFSVSVKDSSSSPESASQAFSINIATGAKSPLQISTIRLPAGQPQAPYAAQLGATGGTAPYNWTVSSGILPTGLTLEQHRGYLWNSNPIRNLLVQRIGQGF